MDLACLTMVLAMQPFSNCVVNCFETDLSKAIVCYDSGVDLFEPAFEFSRLERFEYAEPRLLYEDAFPGLNGYRPLEPLFELKLRW